MSNIEIVANLLQVTPSEATYFCRRVQALSKHTVKFVTIRQTLEKYRMLRKPEELLAAIEREKMLFRGRASLKIIADLLLVDPDEALNFSQRVRGSSKRKIGYHNIIHILRTRPEIRKPAEVAATIEKEALLIEEEKAHFHDQMINERNSYVRPDPEKKSPSGRIDITVKALPSHSSPRSQQQNELTKCPHGVPKVRTCAICDPEAFGRQHGWD